MPETTVVRGAASGALFTIDSKLVAAQVKSGAVLKVDADVAAEFHALTAGPEQPDAADGAEGSKRGKGKAAGDTEP